jgi:hypothetical protein
MHSVPPVPSKKRYQRPSLRLYGSIEALTANVGNTTANLDIGGGGAMQKTH